MKPVFCLIIFIMIVNNSFSQSVQRSSSQPAIVLVHGAWFGSFAWHKAIPLLKQKGYRVSAPDLPGYGDDSVNAPQYTLADYVNVVVTNANQLPGKVILLGHSMGGAVISQAAEVLGADKVSKLIYLDAFLLKNGESIFDQVAHITKAAETAQPKLPDMEPDFLVFSDDKKLVNVSADRKRQVFCHDCPDDDLALLKTHSRWQPVAVLAAPIQVTGPRYGAISKYYIHCTASRDLDRRSILNNMPVKKVVKLTSSHSPFFSMPDKLVEAIDDIVKDPV